jgi:hypothetical protein
MRINRIARRLEALERCYRPPDPRQEARDARARARLESDPMARALVAELAEVVDRYGICDLQGLLENAEAARLVNTITGILAGPEAPF